MAFGIASPELRAAAMDDERLAGCNHRRLTPEAAMEAKCVKPPDIRPFGSGRRTSIRRYAEGCLNSAHDRTAKAYLVQPTAGPGIAPAGGGGGRSGYEERPCTASEWAVPHSLYVCCHAANRIIVPCSLFPRKRANPWTGKLKPDQHLADLRFLPIVPRFSILRM
jgi:hypothetical protein